MNGRVEVSTMFQVNTPNCQRKITREGMTRFRRSSIRNSAKYSLENKDKNEHEPARFVRTDEVKNAISEGIVAVAVEV